ncbi:protein D2-like [Maniola jurtina]|uniref:protein D2-like n=1 Tax=Maniola jurtina TaxID=191418 RepID=UPI001E68D60F|nr:protein D2-like [Maniola jurtina]
MKLLIACIAVVTLAAEVELQKSYRQRRKNSVVKAFSDADIVPEVIATAPEQFLGAWYGENEINLGTDMFAGDGIELPTLEYDVEPGCFYTFMIFDKDVPCAKNPSWRSYLMGMWVNVVDMDLESSCEIATYVAPSPIPGTGPHTYIMLLYKQAEEIDATDENLTCLQNDRLMFCVEDFAANYSLCDPVAGNFYTSVFPMDGPNSKVA